jgi:hypothetical protein
VPDGEILRFLFAGLLAVTAIRLFMDQRKKETGIPAYDPFILLAGGFITGIASGMFGIGGGVILVPFLIVIAGFPTKKSSRHIIGIYPVLFSRRYNHVPLQRYWNRYFTAFSFSRVYIHHSLCSTCHSHDNNDQCRSILKQKI